MNGKEVQHEVVISNPVQVTGFEPYPGTPPPPKRRQCVR